MAQVPSSYYQSNIRFILGLAVALNLVLPALPFSPVPTPAAAAAVDANTWSRVNIPAEGDPGGWVLASGSDIEHLALAADGAIYAAVKGSTYTLYRSTNGGYTWSHPGNVKDSITVLATIPGEPGYLYYATKSDVYRSADSARTFQRLSRPDGAGAGNVEITALAAVRLKANIVAVATRDTDAGQFGGIYTLNEEDVIPVWADTGLNGYDVYTVAFSPNYVADRGLAAVANNEVDTLILFKWGGRGWSLDIGPARLNRDNSSPVAAVPTVRCARLAFPSDYEADPSSANCVLFAAIDTGTGLGDVYRIGGARAPLASMATDLNAGSISGLKNIDISGLASSGKRASARLIAGVASDSKVYSSLDSGASWTVSRKSPTGTSKTLVLIAPNGSGWAASSGQESAFSISRDGAVTWDQAGLIDTTLTTILDLAPSASYDQDRTLFLLTFGGKHSLWRSHNAGESWERVFSSVLPGVDSLKLVSIPPNYGPSRQVLFVAGMTGSNWAIWKSSDDGRTFTCTPTMDPSGGGSIRIDILKAVSDQALAIGSFDGSNGLIFWSYDSGLSFTVASTIGALQLNSMALSPGFARDGTVLVGNRGGWVYLSTDNASTFAALPRDASAAPLSAAITLAFDAAYATNHTVYAASDNTDKGVYRFVIGSSPGWERIDTSLPGGALITQVVVTANGVLYASNRKPGQGMERSLNAASRTGPGPVFESLTLGLADTATLTGLWASQNRVWSVDTANIKLVTLRDEVILPPALSAPPDKVSGIGTVNNHAVKNVQLEWTPVDAATSYQWQVDTDSNFSSILAGFDNTTRSNAIRLPALDPATRYYWRVRIAAPVLGEWSEVRSFTTGLDMEAVPLKLESPAASQKGVPIQPLLVWAPLVGADAYELMVSRDASFASPVVTRLGTNSILTSSWVCDKKLEYGATYYWRVRALIGNIASAWSGIGSFTTEAAPLPSVRAIPPTPTPVAAAAPDIAEPSQIPSRSVPFLDSRPQSTRPPETVFVPYPESPPWVAWLIAGQIVTTLGLTAALMVLALRRR